MRLTFLIATSDRREALARCLDSIDSQDHRDRETIVVVDGSTDGTVEMLAETYPHVIAIVQPERRGLGAALRTGVLAASGDVLVNLDDDAALASPDAASRVVATFAARPDIGVVCMRVEAPDGTVRHREIPLRSKRMPTVDTEIGYFLGGAVALRREALDTAGGYPASIAYGSWENDLSFRLHRTGRRILFTPDIRVIHWAIPSRHNTDEREANYVRNETLIAARYLPGPYAQVHASLWIALCLAQATGRGHLRKTLSAVVRALRQWGEVRSDASVRLTRAQTRDLSRLSGRTWY